jgi:hypothetical protein
VIRAVLATLLLLSMAPLAYGERLWLVIGASDASAMGIAHKAKRLETSATNGFVADMRDCAEKRDVFAWVMNVSTTESDARHALQRARETSKDAYLRACDVKPGSLLALRVSAVHPSIADVPSSAVNWDERDRVSSARLLPDGRTLVVNRHFVPAPDDPLEGRRERVLLADAAGTLHVLEENCLDSTATSSKSGFLALECVREQAANHLLHNVIVFDASGRKVTEVPRCRRPAWSGSATLACQEEAVRSDGHLVLQRKIVDMKSQLPTR